MPEDLPLSWKEYTRVRNVVLSVSLVAWILMVAEPGGASCCTARRAAGTWNLLLAANPPGALAAGWALMLVAMMSPMLPAVLHDLRMSSLARRRGRAIACFVLGYGGVWMAAGGVMLAIAAIAQGRVPGSWWPGGLMAAAAIIWQASPWKQRCLNRCHRHPPLAAFGAAADWSALRNGLEHGVWCAGSCWAAMWFPVLVPQGHLLAMAAITVLMVSERLDRPRPPGWRLRGLQTGVNCVRLWLRHLTWRETRAAAADA